MKSAVIKHVKEKYGCERVLFNAQNNEEIHRFCKQEIHWKTDIDDDDVPITANASAKLHILILDDGRFASVIGTGAGIAADAGVGLGVIPLGGLNLASLFGAAVSPIGIGSAVSAIGGGATASRVGVTSDTYLAKCITAEEIFKCINQSDFVVSGGTVETVITVDQ